MLHFVCFLSISEVETWTEMNWLHPNLDTTNTPWQEKISRIDSLTAPSIESTCLDLAGKHLGIKVLNLY